MRNTVSSHAYDVQRESADAAREMVACFVVVPEVLLDGCVVSNCVDDPAHLPLLPPTWLPVGLRVLSTPPCERDQRNGIALATYADLGTKASCDKVDIFCNKHHRKDEAAALCA